MDIWRRLRLRIRRGKGFERSTPTLHISTGSDFSLSIRHLLVARCASPFWEIAAWKASGKMPIGETGCIQIILELAGQGLLDRLRECDAPHRLCADGRCGAWFVAANNKKTVCGDNCRARKGQHTDEFREKHRKYMRKYNSPAMRRERRMRGTTGKGSK